MLPMPLGPKSSDGHILLASEFIYAVWRLVSLAFVSSASLLDNLIEAVNILGSIFYGMVPGLIMVGLFVKRGSAPPVFVAALIAQAVVPTLFFRSLLRFLWFNVVGCGLVIAINSLLRPLIGARKQAAGPSRSFSGLVACDRYEIVLLRGMTWRCP